MTDRDYPNSGILFGNDRKRGERDPDHKGNAHIACPNCGNRGDFLVGAWNKIARNGNPFLSLSFRPKDDAALHSTERAAPVRTRPARRSRDDDDDIPTSEEPKTEKKRKRTNPSGDDPDDLDPYRISWSR